MTFANLKKQSSLGSLTAKLVKEVEKMNTQAGGADERLWKPEMDKSGNGYAVIRFLPAPDGEELPWAKMYSHAFQGPGGWYIENSLTTLGQQDPIAELNRQLWNSGIDSDKEVARKQKRKLSYYSNVYIIKDPANPQFEGRVMLYKYGKKIHDKIIEMMQPEFDDQEAIDPFDFWAGADFNLRLKKVAGFWNYDSSAFARPSTLGGFDDQKLESIYNQMHDLNEFTDAKNFKTYAELQARLNAVLNARPVAPEVRDEEADFNAPDITRSAPEMPASMKQELNNLTASAAPAASEDNYSYFDSLANEDF